MPLPLEAVVAGAGVVSGAVNAFSQGNMNKKNRQHQEYMWNKQNQYNTPTAQMQRFKDAGLNPHLIYGQGSNGNAMAPNTPNQEPIKTNFMDVAMQYVATKKQQTEIDNLEKAKEVMEADRILKEATTVNTLTNSSKTEQERQQSADLFQTVSDQAKMNLSNSTLQSSKISSEINQIRASTRLTDTQKNNVEQSIRESQQRINNLRKDASIKDKEAELKQLDINLKRNGIQPSDPLYMRIISQLLEQSSIGNWLKNQSQTIKEKFR